MSLLTIGNVILFLAGCGLAVLGLRMGARILVCVGVVTAVVNLVGIVAGLYAGR